RHCLIQHFKFQVQYLGNEFFVFMSQCGFFEFFSKMSYRASYGPGCCIPQWADRIAFNFLCYIHQNIDVFFFTVTMLQAMKNFLHPSRAFATRAALSTGFMMIE